MNKENWKLLWKQKKYIWDRMSNPKQNLGTVKKLKVKLQTLCIPSSIWGSLGLGGRPRDFLGDFGLDRFSDIFYLGYLVMCM